MDPQFPLFPGWMPHIAVADKHLHCYAKPCCEAGWSDCLCLLFRKAADSLCKPMSQYKLHILSLPFIHLVQQSTLWLYDVHSQFLIYTLNLAIQPSLAPYSSST